MREGLAVVAMEEEEDGGMAVDEEEEGGTAGGWARRGLEGKAVCSSRYELKAS
jgi:hypothetical protein